MALPAAASFDDSSDALISSPGSDFPPTARSWYRTRLRVPDLGRILPDRAVARERSGTGHVQDGLLRPPLLVGIHLEEPPVRLQIGAEVRQVHVVVASGQQALAQRLEDARLIAAEVIG